MRADAPAHGKLCRRLRRHGSCRTVADLFRLICTTLWISGITLRFKEVVISDALFARPAGFARLAREIMIGFEPVLRRSRCALRMEGCRGVPVSGSASLSCLEQSVGARNLDPVLGKLFAHLEYFGQLRDVHALIHQTEQ